LICFIDEYRILVTLADGLLKSAQCRLAESKKVLDQYGIPQEEIKAAQLRLEQQSPAWKEDDDYERDLREQQALCERQLASPSPPTYSVLVGDA